METAARLHPSWFVLLLLLAACQPREPASFNGYVEAEFVRVAAPQAGRLVALPAQRGASVASGAPLFVLEHDIEAAAVSESVARVERSDAQARDLTRGQHVLLGIELPHLTSLPSCHPRRWAGQGQPATTPARNNDNAPKFPPGRGRDRC